MSFVKCLRRRATAARGPSTPMYTTGPTRFGQLALRRLVQRQSMPRAASGSGQPRPASAKQPLGPRWHPDHIGPVFLTFRFRAGAHLAEARLHALCRGGVPAHAAPTCELTVCTNLCGKGAVSCLPRRKKTICTESTTVCLQNWLLGRETRNAVKPQPNR